MPRIDFSLGIRPEDAWKGIGFPHFVRDKLQTTKPKPTLREESPRLHINKLPASRSVICRKSKLQLLVLRRRKRITRRCVEFSIHGDGSVLHLDQLEVYADGFVLIEEGRDLVLERSARVHSRHIKGTQNSLGTVALKPFRHLAQQLRRRALRKRAGRLLVL